MEEYGKVLSRLQGRCAKREYCRSDIFRKALAAFDGDREQAGRLLDSLVEDRFVDDLRYASAFAREKSRLTGWGPAKISSSLMVKGIERSVIASALKEIDQEEAGRRMRSVLEAKYRTLRGDPQEKFKLLRFGLSRGYEYDILAPAVEEILKKND